MRKPLPLISKPIPMRYYILLFLFLSYLVTNAQQKYFEGQITYNRTVHSTSYFSDEEVTSFLLLGSPVVNTIKNGNYLLHSPICDQWVISDKKRAYCKFPNLDTLYYTDFSEDTSSIIAVSKGEAPFSINQHCCKSLLLKTPAVTKTFYYATDLFLNPEYDKDNTLGKYNVYSQETNGAVYLWKKEQYSFAYAIDSCISITPANIDDHVFQLPDLPQKKFKFGELVISPQFTGGSRQWQKYLLGNLNTDLAVKYVKLPRKQAEASETVLVTFTVNIDGTLADIKVIGDTKDIHPALVNEALRVINKSPKWTPGTIFGEKCKMNITQPVIFQVMRQP